MENMNKENFWNSLYESYPNAMKEFCDFIDEYKEECQWKDIFDGVVKFHDVPVEMRFGIWLRFQFEQGCGAQVFTLESDCFEISNLWEWASEWFMNRERQIQDEA